MEYAHLCEVMGTPLYALLRYLLYCLPQHGEKMLVLQRVQPSSWADGVPLQQHWTREGTHTQTS